MLRTIFSLLKLTIPDTASERWLGRGTGLTVPPLRSTRLLFDQFCSLSILICSLFSSEPPAQRECCFETNHLFSTYVSAILVLFYVRKAFEGPA